MLPSVYSICKAMYCGDELFLTRPPSPEAVLKVTQNLVTFQTFHEMTMYYMFHDCNNTVKIHDSQTYRNMHMTRVRISYNKTDYKFNLQGLPSIGMPYQPTYRSFQLEAVQQCYLFFCFPKSTGPTLWHHRTSTMYKVVARRKQVISAW